MLDVPKPAELRPMPIESFYMAYGARRPGMDCRCRLRAGYGAASVLSGGGAAVFVRCRCVLRQRIAAVDQVGIGVSLLERIRLPPMNADKRRSK
jgi:hypothetical protein